MFKRVMEDGRYGPQRRPTGKSVPQTGESVPQTGRPVPQSVIGPSRIGLVLVAVAALGVSAGTAAGQDDRDTREFRASIVDLSTRLQRVTVPLHRSVTVETTVEVTRADVIARHIADVQVISPTRLLITGQSFGNTSLVLLGADSKQYVFNVSVELDVDKLNETLRAVDPQSTALASSVVGNIVLTGTVSSAERAQRMVELAQLFLPPSTGKGAKTTVQNHLAVSGEQQVLLRCVVAEVSRTATRELGVNGFLAGENFRDAFVVNQIGGINPIDMGAAAEALVTQNLPFLTGEDGIPILQNTTLSLGFPRVQMQLFLRAMADNKLLRVLAEPNLVAVSGETAMFLAGGEFPIPVPQGNQVVTIEFREFGVRLEFTPIVLGGQRIRLRVAPEVSELDFSTAAQFQGFVIPGLSSRAVETTIELGSGQTIAIAGLLNEQLRGIATRVPGIGDVPILGALFRSVSYQRSLTELVILVTPEIVAPLEPHQIVRLPGESLTEPNDFELYVLGLLESPGGDSQDTDDSGSDRESDPDELSLHGPWGPAGAADFR